MQSVNRQGFTLIELLVVVAIIGLLATLATIGLNNSRKKARDVKRKADISQIAKALELYYNDNSRYPTTASYGESNLSGWDTSYIDGDNDGIYFMDFLEENNITKNIKDPINDASHHYRYYFYANDTYGCEGPFYVILAYGLETSIGDSDTVCYTPWAGNNNVYVVVGGQ